MSKKVEEAYERGYADGRREAGKDVLSLRARAIRLLRNETVSGITTPAAATALLCYLEDAEWAAADDLDWSGFDD